MNVGVTVLLRQYITTPLCLSFIEYIHTGIEYDGVEYCFTPSGIEEVKPRQFYQYQSHSQGSNQMIQDVKLGKIPRRKFYSTLNKLSDNFTNTSYNLLSNNCNCFTYELIQSLFTLTDIEIKESFISAFFIKYGRLEKTLLIQNILEEERKLLEEKDKILINKIRLLTEDLIYGKEDTLESKAEIENQSIISNVDTDYTDSFFI